MYYAAILNILLLLDMISPEGRMLNGSRIQDGDFSYRDAKALSDTVNVLDWGAKGDGVTDDREAIQKALLYCAENKKVCYIPKSKAVYLIKSTIRVPLNSGQKLAVFSDQATIKPAWPFRNSSLARLTAFNENTVLSVGPDNLGKKAPSVSDIFNNNSHIAVSISGLKIDGGNIQYSAVPAGFNTPICIGLAISAENISVTHCYFYRIFGDGIMVMGPGNFNCTDNKFEQVGGRGKTPFAFKVDNDHFGDAVNISAVRKNGKVDIRSCTMQGYESQGRRSRCGITFNFSKYNYSADITQCTIAGYAKCVHVEEKTASRFNITGCIWKDFSYGMANVLDSGTVCRFTDCKIEISRNDGQDAAGAALLGLNYKSNAGLYFDRSEINFVQCGRYQSVAPVRSFNHCKFNANHRNIFFADAHSLLFDHCIFNEFGGKQKSFYACCGRKMKVAITDSFFNNSGPVTADKKSVQLTITNSPSLVR